MYSLSRNKPFYFTLKLLNMFFWYPVDDGKTYKIIFLAISASLRLISLLSAVGTLIHLILTMKNTTTIDMSEDIGDLLGFVNCMMPCLIFLANSSRWSNMFNNLLEFSEFGVPSQYQKTVKKGNFISLVGLVYTVPGMGWYCYLAYKEIPNCHETNLKLGLKEACGFPNPTWIPFDHLDGWLYLVCYFFQALGIFVYLPSAFGICLIVLEAADIIVTRIQDLKGLFKKMFQVKDRNLRLKRLRYCINYHQDIIRVSKELSGLVRLTLGSLILTSAVVIGSLGSQLIKSSTPKAISFVLGCIFALFVVCHAGQKLIDQSLDLTNHVYDSQWYETDAEMRRDVAFVLARCQKALFLAAPFSMGTAGYVLFAILIKTSYSYLTLLNKVV